MTLEANRLACSCLVEHLGSSGEVERKQSVKSALLDLGRNEVGDVVLRMIYPPEQVLGPFTVREHSVHKRFLKEGKASIRLITQNVNFLLSNCPPNQLSEFFRCLSVKLAARGKLQGASRRMIGDVSLQFEEISPLSRDDFEEARKNKDVKNLATTPQRKAVPPPQVRTLKRTFSEIQQQGCSSGGGASGGAAVGEKPSKRAVLGPSDPKGHGDTNGNGNGSLPSGSRRVAPSLSPEQQQVIQLVRSGKNIFFTGSAGTGKSFLLKRIISSLPPDTTCPTASTGAAACHIAGTTVHSFAGIGTGEGSLEQCIHLASQDRRAQLWKKCKCLVVDEVSMISAEFFDKLEAVARAVRKNKRPFGGIQLVLCGDFLQLPPVTKDGAKRQYCFQARSWNSCVTHTVELTQIYRQSEKRFVGILQNIRIGRCPPAITNILRGTEANKIEGNGIKATKLYTHTQDVENTNTLELSKLPGRMQKFLANDSDPSLAGKLDAVCPASSCIELKTGAQVMLLKNMDVTRGLVNGARGVVRGFDQENKGYPVIQFMCGLTKTMGVEKWLVKMAGGVVCMRKQLPLRLAWAISIHKSQGMTLDCVEISLAKTFEDGQAYVALSRARSLHTLRVRGFEPSCVRAHPQVLEYYKALRQTRRNYLELAADR